MDLEKPRRPRGMSGEIGAAQLEELQAQLDRLREKISYAHSVTAQAEETVRSVIQRRREREQLFGEELFADPAWDIFLELYAAHLAQQRVPTSKLCDAAAVPATTALRWIDKLEDSGWVVRTPDRFHGRRVFVELTPRAREAMQRYFNDAV